MRIRAFLGGVVLTSCCSAQPGVLDLTYSGDGIALGTADPFVQSPAQEVAMQADGKVVAVGQGETNFSVARFTLGGTLDPSFGDGGTLTTTLSAVTDRAYAVAVAPDGRIVAAGYSHGGQRLAMVCYLPDGTTDASFGTNGRVTTIIGTYAAAY